MPESDRLRAGVTGSRGIHRRPRPAWARKPLRRTSSVRRLNVTLLSVAFAISLIVGRLIQLQGVDASRYRTLSQHELMQTVPIPSVRGEIVSSDGTVLAMTVQTDEVTADPPTIKASAKLAVVAGDLAGLLRMTQARLLSMLKNPTSQDYTVLKQSVDATTAGAIAKLGLPGIYLQPTYSRVYPGGDLAAGLLGSTHTSQVDDVSTGQPTDVMTGWAGVEEEYNALLAGKSGAEAEEVGPDGLIPGTESTIRAAVPASSLRLTIQADIQWEAQRECAIWVRKTEAKTCSVIVIQPSTGRILALAQYPTFNPGGPIASIAATKDVPVAEMFAPGSTAKVITAAAAFQDAGETPRTSYVVPDSIYWPRQNGALYHDAEGHATQRYTIAGIIAHSLNDGMVQVASHVTPAEQYKMFRAFGIGSPSGLNLPGETPGELPAPSQWTGNYRNERYQISFGQSVDVTAIQMASVYATIANGGVRVAPSIVAGHTTSSGRYVPAPRPASRRVISRKTAAQLISALEQVPIVYAQAGETEGLIPGYTVAAKTGTAQELPGNTYGSSFIGIAPATTSNGLVVAVNIQDPRRNGYFGIQVAGPVFNAVMKFALATMKIPPNGGHVPSVPLTVP